MRTNVLDNDAGYVIMISEHTFERRKEGRIHMKNISTFEKIVEILKQMNERQLNLILSFVRNLM
jgi:hypothetical protein